MEKNIMLMLLDLQSEKKKVFKSFNLQLKKTQTDVLAGPLQMDKEPGRKKKRKKYITTKSKTFKCQKKIGQVTSVLK